MNLSGAATLCGLIDAIPLMPIGYRPAQGFASMAGLAHRAPAGQ
jgi:hypothetical protein